MTLVFTEQSRSHQRFSLGYTLTMTTPMIYYKQFIVNLSYNTHLTSKINQKFARCLPRTDFTPATGKPYSGERDIERNGCPPVRMVHLH